MCSSAGTGCACDVTKDDTIEELATAYADVGGTVTVGSNTYATCVGPADTLVYTRTDSQSIEDGQFTLTLQ